MKRIVSFLLTAILLLSLGACSRPETQDPVPQAPQADSSAVPTEAPEEVPEEAPTEAPTEVPEKSPEEAPAQDISFEAVYQQLMQLQADAGKEELILFSESNPDILNGLYPGLGEISLAQQMVYVPPVSGFACEIMLVEVADPADVAAVEEIFRERIARGSEEICDIEVAHQWQDFAQVQTSGSYVAMIVLPAGYEIPENIFALG